MGEAGEAQILMGGRSGRTAFSQVSRGPTASPSPKFLNSEVPNRHTTLDPLPRSLGSRVRVGHHGGAQQRFISFLPPK